MTIPLTGTLNREYSSHLRATLRTALNARQPVRIDMRHVAALDSAILANLIEACAIAKQEGIAFTLIDPAPAVRSMLDLYRLTPLFTIETTPPAMVL